MSDRALDFTVVICYLLAITVYGLWFARRSNKSKAGYFLGDRQFGWLMVGFSLFATNISIGAFVGGSGLAYKAGFASITPELQGGLMLVVSAIIFVPLFRRSNLFTIPQFLELRYSRSAKILYGGLFACQSVLTSPVGMFTGALALLKLFGFELSHTNVTLAALGIAMTVGLYSIFGGMASVVVTDLIQAILMIGGGLLITFLGLQQVGGWDALQDKIGVGMFHLWRPASDPQFPWTAAIPGQLLHAAFYAFCNIALLQRALAARDVNQAQKGMVLAAFLKMGGILLFTLPGLIAIALYPEAAKPDETYPMMVRDLLPAGLSGLVMAGLLAAMMSSQDSGINAIAGVVALDIYPVFRKNASEREGVLVGKFFAGSNILWGVVAAPFLLGADQGIYSMILKITGFMILPTGTCYLIGRFVRRVNHYGAVTTLIVGLLMGIYYIVFSTLPSLRHLLPDVVANAHFYHVYPFFFLIFSAVLIGVSLLTPPPPPEKLECIQPARTHVTTTAHEPWYNNFKFWLAVYVVALVLVYSVFN